MQDTIKVNRIVTPPSPVRLVMRSDPNGHENQQTPLKDSQGPKRSKKKKKDVKKAKVSEREISISAGPHQKRSVKKRGGESGQPKVSTQIRSIDILV